MYTFHILTPLCPSLLSTFHVFTKISQQWKKNQLTILKPHLFMVRNSTTDRTGLGRPVAEFECRHCQRWKNTYWEKTTFKKRLCLLYLSPEHFCRLTCCPRLIYRSVHWSTSDDDLKQCNTSGKECRPLYLLL